MDKATILNQWEIAAPGWAKWEKATAVLYDPRLAANRPYSVII